MDGGKDRASDPAGPLQPEGRKRFAGELWWKDAILVALLGLGVRLSIVAWASVRFPPAADGIYYERIAERIAGGFGYTWLWPDGVVTYAAHYPVGYPAMVALLYRLVGPHPAVAMVLNAALGGLSVLAVHRLAARAGGRVAAALGAMLVALHPGLVAYTPALMTEGVTASLWASAAWSSAAARERVGSGRAAALAATGVLVGLATLVRPQSLLLAPFFGWIAGGRTARRTRLIGAAFVMAIALLVCAPWTVRNCIRMHRCALVSVNGGWNLLIGADPASTGAWAPVQVPAACREVWDEAEKDACFGREARRFIAEHPAAWLSLVPRKLAATFDYCGAAGWYLHESNPEEFTERHKTVLGAVETLYERLVLAAVLVWAARAALTANGASRAALPVRVSVAALAAVSAVGVFSTHAWLAYVALLGLCALQGRRLARGPALPMSAVVVLFACVVTHAIFFGAGRYSLLVFPLLSGLAGAIFDRAHPTPAF